MDLSSWGVIISFGAPLGYGALAEWSTKGDNHMLTTRQRTLQCAKLWSPTTSDRQRWHGWWRHCWEPCVSMLGTDNAMWKNGVINRTIER